MQQQTFLYLTPSPEISLVSSAMPPGLSLTCTTNRTSLPSTARPLSMTRPSAVVSMLPPHNAITTLVYNKTLNHDVSVVTG